MSSIIGRTASIRGHVRGTGPIEVAGRIEGDVSTDGDVTLSEGSVVQGDVSGATVRVAGTVAGNITATDTLQLENGARVVGDLVAPRLGIADGALVKGAVRTEDMGTAPRPAARPAPRREPAPREEPAAPKASRPAPEKPAAKPAPRSPSRSSRSETRSAPAKSETKAPAKKASKKSARKPPAPVVPALAKGTRGRKKKAKRK